MFFVKNLDFEMLCESCFINRKKHLTAKNNKFKNYRKYSDTMKDKENKMLLQKGNYKISHKRHREFQNKVQRVRSKAESAQKTRGPLAMSEFSAM